MQKLYLILLFTIFTVLFIEPQECLGQADELIVPTKGIAKHPLLTQVEENSKAIKTQEDIFLDTLIAIIFNTENSNEFRRGAVFELGKFTSNPKAALFLVRNIHLKIDFPPLFSVGADNYLLESPCAAILTKVDIWVLLPSIFVVLKEKKLSEDEIWLFALVLEKIKVNTLRSILQDNLTIYSTISNENIKALLDFIK